MTTPINAAKGPLGHGAGTVVNFTDTQYDGGTMEQFNKLIPCVIVSIDETSGDAKLRPFIDSNVNPDTAYPYSEAWDPGHWTPVDPPT